MPKGPGMHWQNYDGGWRDRPTAKDLLEDEWFQEDGEE
jgi:hypothetical protein